MPRQPSSMQPDTARHAFFDGGGGSARVAPAILQSWQRCRQLGLEAEALPAIEPVPQARLRQMRESNERLWQLARAELEVLARDAHDTGSMVILTDAEGWILDAAGSSAFLDKAGRVALMPGASWNEHSAGTNAIGTAIVEQRAVAVHGGEHYFAPHGILSCASCPVFSPDGRLAGVLDISGDASVTHMHASGLARLAVDSIEHRYFDGGIADAVLLRVHQDRALLGTAREGLLAFRGGRLVAANRAGLGLFGLGREDIGRAAYAALFDASVSHLRDDGVLLDRQGRALYGTVDADDRPRPRRASTRAAPITVTPATAPLSDAQAPLFDAALDDELERARRVLDAGLPLLVLGETGTGKEVFARELHRRCARAGKPFVAVNCAALPEGLIEAELFGYEGGAFTGARRQGSQGLLRQADGGVLFLDEIGDMPLALQPRLLRVLQERELSPLGGGRPVKLDFALVCATHQELEGAIGAGRFRPDLFYRIAHHQVRLAPLRDHADRSGLVQALWRRIGRGRTLDPAALAALAAHPWPGNLRQLSACLHTLVALSEPGQHLGCAHLPAYLQGAATASSSAPPAPGSLDQLTEAAMHEALRACDGNVVHAARRLGISRSTLYRRLGGRLRGAGG